MIDEADSWHWLLGEVRDVEVYRMASGRSYVRSRTSGLRLEVTRWINYLQAQGQVDVDLSGWWVLTERGEGSLAGFDGD